MREILDSSWFLFMNDRHKRLVETAVILYEREIELKSSLEDYSFIVFPMSKAYEGFLKRSFLDLKLIDEHTFEGHRFRIGKALNPDMHENQRDKYWLFDDLEQICGHFLARHLWETWLECRNRIFHFYAKDDNVISLETAGEKLLMLSNAMKSLVECQIDLGKKHAQVYNIPL
ncbi:MAG: hypothetical protein COZ34_00600 [Candidatus Pacebacteria bacterium CG_4_10_14_3_um_filter_34_15]|nr:hypothetical protein [Candidatus Pacearchaeota archaeon]NCQ65811.1 hypothetical protein [Candidatus Paceibacterota bacterium]OIO43830.1 MAG: hypothetical protein AUJ41_04260 [Candidatus Pacebacteria bacterium CG1_02_43_31]PIQ81182.1 MAG: hypothetical protein COV78_01620 [Candidatus Pacebacteria bacterium CG11_big_fil_rev_8_21_14_0_20_34_55]PIX81969.1 MAG: hypothetical protein COZ34_00600 [Candidatus Pacebacteria bacterium CG_4_10_14_3_um_filter_34_15]PJC44194.1 MAG: hypothetical protein CO0